jgi:hypothetical protein
MEIEWDTVAGGMGQVNGKQVPFGHGSRWSGGLILDTSHSNAMPTASSMSLDALGFNRWMQRRLPGKHGKRTWILEERYDWPCAARLMTILAVE